ncbi:hypothetical protein, conserved [Eimeria necatrix]|uniref:RING-type E3 ubiquitin transferase n=1 Tax=Eimeria necatrix TaxID=51315 RepID=U6MTP1_9EIME|nr:hypothetical protein, conserved [Eimeria necatrix]CDJ67557.1 hypothetical protein, conserved [Eimeria necatrix]
MTGAADSSPQSVNTGAKNSRTPSVCNISTSGSIVCNEAEEGEAAGSGDAEYCAANSQGDSICSEGAQNPTVNSTATERTAVEKIHLLPISEEAPKSWVFATLTGLMKECKTVQQYMYIRVKRPTKENKSPQKGRSRDESDKALSLEATDAEYNYIVVACLPHSGVITSSTVVFTTGAPLKPLRRIQLLALVHPNSSYARKAGVASYSEALQRGLVGEGSAASQSRRSRRADSTSSSAASPLQRPENNSNSIENGVTTGEAGYGAADAEMHHRQLGSPFDWEGTHAAGQRHRRRPAPVREFSRAEDVIAAVLEDSDAGSGGENGGDEDSMGGTPFRLSDATGPEASGARSDSNEAEPPMQHQRTLQLNFNFSSSSSTDFGASRSGTDGSPGDAPRSLSERVLFYDFVAPYFRARGAGASLPSSPANAGTDGTSRDTAIVVFPGKKLVIRDLTFVVWATDPDNGPGFVRKDTAMYISVDPWGEYRRVHILPFADTLPTTYSFRLFEDYLQPFLKEQPWRLIRKGDIFTFRGVEFKVIATEPSTIPVARVGPETVVHFEGSLNPSLIDILPPDILSRVRRLPARVQPFAIVAAAQSLDPQLLLRVLPSGNMRGNPRGIDEGLEAAVERQLVGPFCLSAYQRLYAHLCTRKKRHPSREKREEAEASGEADTPRCSQEIPSSRSSTAEAEAAVAEAAAGGWELEAPCCTVCTLQLQDGAESVTLTCGHAFHWDCARAWLRCSATCPNCRAEVVLPSEDHGECRGSNTNVGTAALGFVRSAWADFFNS